MRTFSALSCALAAFMACHGFAAERPEDRPLRTTFGDDNTDAVLPSFAGIWLADGDESMGLPVGCSLLVRVSAEPQQLLRAVICGNGDVQTELADVTGIGIEPSRFPGGFQLRSRLGEARSSCASEQKSILPGFTPLVFDLKTAAGGEAATFAYMQLGSVEVALHSGGAVDAFDRNKDCTTLQRLAKRPSGNNNALLTLAAKVCALDGQSGGCFTADGYVPGVLR